MLGDLRVEKCVIGKQNFFDRSIRATNMLKKADGFIVERRAQPVIEFREPLRIDAAIAVKLIKAEPLPEKLRREATSLHTVQHATGLLSQLLRIAELARLSHPP